MSAPWTFRSVVPTSAVPPGSTQIVTLHGLQSASGQITGLELLASSNIALNQSALEMASNSSARELSDDLEPGATPQSHEILYNVVFVPAQK